MFKRGALFLVLGASLFAVSLSAATDKKVTKKPLLKSSEKTVIIPLELLAIEKKYLASKTFEAEFAQHDDVKLTGTKKVSSGVLMIRHPDQFRWETLKPDKSLLISDGKRFWFYTPPFEAGERGQVIEKKTNEVQSELANALLAGAFSKIRGVTITRLSADKFRLLPGTGVAGSVKTAEIEIDLEKNLIKKLRLEHLGGNRTEISLTNIKLGGKVADAYFKFVTPPGTDVVRE